MDSRASTIIYLAWFVLTANQSQHGSAWVAQEKVPMGMYHSKNTETRPADGFAQLREKL